MKRLGIIYFSLFFAIIAVTLVAYFMGNHKRSVSVIPEKISVYFTDENEVRQVETEEYLKYVVAAEVPGSFGEEAIKAQAVAARTYILNKYRNSSPSEEHHGAVVCTDSTHCCAYSSEEELVKQYGKQWMDEYFEKISRCTEATKGEYLTFDGQVISAAFHASSGGGRTENSRDVWGGERPYLVSVESPGEDSRNGYFSTVTLTCDDFKSKINSTFPEAKLGDDRNKWLGEVCHTPGNSVDTINIGSAKIKGVEMRSLFQLKSACFEINILDDKITFKVQGSGHGVGLSQHGANYMAKQGKTYKEILTWYYQGVKIEK